MVERVTAVLVGVMVILGEITVVVAQELVPNLVKATEPVAPVLPVWFVFGSTSRRTTFN